MTSRRVLRADQTAISEAGNEVPEEGFLRDSGHTGRPWRRGAGASRSPICLQSAPGKPLATCSCTLLICSAALQACIVCCMLLCSVPYHSLQFAGGFDVDTMRAFQELKETASAFQQWGGQNQHLHQQRLAGRSWDACIYSSPLLQDSGSIYLLGQMLHSFSVFFFYLPVKKLYFDRFFIIFNMHKSMQKDA